MVQGSNYQWLSFLITSMSNYSVQYNFHSITMCLLIMSANECTSNDDNCKDGKHILLTIYMISRLVYR